MKTLTLIQAKYNLLAHHHKVAWGWCGIHRWAAALNIYVNKHLQHAWYYKNWISYWQIQAARNRSD